jgi:RNA polymerase sigma-70 factor (ECF subfamily)
VDHARRRGSAKRGGGQARTTFDEGMARVEPDWGLVELDEVLQALAAKDERKSKVVELRFFGGLGTDEVAEILGVTPQTIRRDWRLSKAWLLREMTHRGKGDGEG